MSSPPPGSMDWDDALEPCLHWQKHSKTAQLLTSGWWELQFGQRSEVKGDLLGVDTCSAQICSTTEVGIICIRVCKYSSEWRLVWAGQASCTGNSWAASLWCSDLGDETSQGDRQDKKPQDTGVSEGSWQKRHMHACKQTPLELEGHRYAWQSRKTASYLWIETLSEKHQTTFQLVFSCWQLVFVCTHRLSNPCDCNSVWYWDSSGLDWSQQVEENTGTTWRRGKRIWLLKYLN